MTGLRIALDDLNAIPATANGTPAPDEADPWKPVNLADLPEHPPVQPTLGNVGLVYPGKRHVFSGPQESAKTLAAYAIGLQVVRAEGHLILIDFEMGAWDARNRLRELGANQHDFQRIHYLEPSEPARDDTMPRLLTLTPSLVIVDAAAGAYDLQGLDDNKRQDVERFTRLYVRAFWKAGVATLVLDHVVKNTESRGKYAVGSERKVGSADVHLGFEVVTPISRGNSGLYKVVTHKDRGGFLQRGTLAEFELQSDPDTHRITWQFKPVERQDDTTWMPTKVMEKISIDLATRYEPPSRKQLIDTAGGRHDVARKAIEHLIRLGYATETSGAHGAKLVQHNTTFTVSEWESKEEERHSPTSSHLVRDQVNQPSPTSSPPYRGTGLGDAAQDDPTWSRPDRLPFSALLDTEPEQDDA